MLKRLPRLIIINGPSSDSLVEPLRAFCKKHDVVYYNAAGFLEIALIDLLLDPIDIMHLQEAEGLEAFWEQVHPLCTTGKTNEQLGLALKDFCINEIGPDFMSHRAKADIAEMLDAYPHVMVGIQSTAAFNIITADLPSTDYRVVQLQTSGEFESTQGWISGVPANIIDFRINPPESNLLALEALFA